MSPDIAIGIATVVVLTITIFAIYYGPISALKIQRRLERNGKRKTASSGYSRR
jgi:hypothetical protein